MHIVMIDRQICFLLPKPEKFWKLWLTRMKSGFSENWLQRSRFPHFQKS